MKHTIASLTCLVTTLQGQVTHLTAELDIVKKRSIYAANRVREANAGTPAKTLEASYAKLSPEAKAKADEVLKRMAERRAQREARNTQQAPAMQ